MILHPGGTVDRGALFTRLLKRNSIRRSLGIRPLDVSRLYFQKLDTLAKSFGKKPFLTKKPIPTKADIEPTESDRQKIMADLVARNVERKAQNLPERDVGLRAELEYARHRFQAYQNLLGPYLEACLLEIQTTGGQGPMPSDYRDAVTKAESQLEAATGVVSPKSKMASEVADLARHNVETQREATPTKT